MICSLPLFHPHILEHIAEINEWHGANNIACSRYTHPRDYAQFDTRAACKTCTVQCVPTNDACAGAEDLEAGFWNKTALKIKAQYVNKAEEEAAERLAEKTAARLQRNLTKELQKVRIKVFFFRLKTLEKYINL